MAPLEITLAKKRILHIITSTDVGGAEIGLFNFLCQGRQDEFSHQVLSLAPIGEIGEKIAQCGILIDSLNMAPGLSGVTSLPHLEAMVRCSCATLIHCWMYHANLLGGLAAARARLPAIWHIHHYNLDATLLKKSTILVARLGAHLSSRLPQKIIYCADSSMREHQRLGYDRHKGIFIPNGFDTARFAPDREGGLQARQQFSIPSNAVVVGQVGRFHPTKDHLTLLRATSMVREAQPETIFVLCGSQVEDSNAQLRAWVEELGLSKNVRLIGAQKDMAAIYNMMDVLVSSSLSEAFPNVIGEAMSCALPCVATDVGDSALLIGDGGLLVPAADAPALAEAILRLLRDQVLRRSLGAAARARIQEHFSMAQMTARLEALYREILSD